MNFVKSLGAAGKRLISGLTAIALSVGVLLSESSIFDNKIEAEAAADTPNWSYSTTYNLLEAKDVISRACTLLGAPYCDPATHLHYAKGLSSQSPDSALRSASNIKSNYGVDCSGLVYWTLKGLGVTISRSGSSGLSTWGLPWVTTEWYNYSNDTAYSNFVMKINDKPTNGVTLKVLRDELKNQDNEYYETSKGSQIIAPGSVVVNHNPSGIDHMWIYIGKTSTASKTAIKNLLSNEYGITGISDSNIYCDANAGTHWRIESAGGVGVRISNTLSGKSSAYGQTAVYQITKNYKAIKLYKSIEGSRMSSSNYSSYFNHSTFTIKTSNGKYINANVNSSGQYEFSGFSSSKVEFNPKANNGYKIEIIGIPTTDPTTGDILKVYVYETGSSPFKQYPSRYRYKITPAGSTASFSSWTSLSNTTRLGGLYTWDTGDTLEIDADNALERPTAVIRKYVNGNLVTTDNTAQYVSKVTFYLQTRASSSDSWVYVKTTSSSGGKYKYSTTVSSFSNASPLTLTYAAHFNGEAYSGLAAVVENLPTDIGREYRVREVVEDKKVLQATPVEAAAYRVNYSNNVFSGDSSSWTDPVSTNYTPTVKNALGVNRMMFAFHDKTEVVNKTTATIQKYIQNSSGAVSEITSTNSNLSTFTFYLQAQHSGVEWGSTSTPPKYVKATLQDDGTYKFSEFTTTPAVYKLNTTHLENTNKPRIKVTNLPDRVYENGTWYNLQYRALEATPGGNWQVVDQTKYYRTGTSDSTSWTDEGYSTTVSVANGSSTKINVFSTKALNPNSDTTGLVFAFQNKQKTDTTTAKAIITKYVDGKILTTSMNSTLKGYMNFKLEVSNNGTSWSGTYVTAGSAVTSTVDGWKGTNSKMYKYTGTSSTGSTFTLTGVNSSNELAAIIVDLPQDKYYRAVEVITANDYVSTKPMAAKAYRQGYENAPAWSSANIVDTTKTTALKYINGTTLLNYQFNNSSLGQITINKYVDKTKISSTSSDITFKLGGFVGPSASTVWATVNSSQQFTGSTSTQANGTSLSLNSSGNAVIKRVPVRGYEGTASFSWSYFAQEFVDSDAPFSQHPVNYKIDSGSWQAAQTGTKQDQTSRVPFSGTFDPNATTLSALKRTFAFNNKKIADATTSVKITEFVYSGGTYTPLTTTSPRTNLTYILRADRGNGWEYVVATKTTSSTSVAFKFSKIVSDISNASKFRIKPNGTGYDAKTYCLDGSDVCYIITDLPIRTDDGTIIKYQAFRTNDTLIANNYKDRRRRSYTSGDTATISWSSLTPVKYRPQILSSYDQDHLTERKIFEFAYTKEADPEILTGDLIVRKHVDYDVLQNTTGYSTFASTTNSKTKISFKIQAKVGDQTFWLTNKVALLTDSNHINNPTSSYPDQGKYAVTMNDWNSSWSGNATAIATNYYKKDPGNGNIDTSQLYTINQVTYGTSGTVATRIFTTSESSAQTFYLQNVGHDVTSSTTMSGWAEPRLVIIRLPRKVKLNGQIYDVQYAVKESIGDTGTYLKMGKAATAYRWYQQGGGAAASWKNVDPANVQVPVDENDLIHWVDDPDDAPEGTTAFDNETNPNGFKVSTGADMTLRINNPGYGNVTVKKFVKDNNGNVTAVTSQKSAEGDTPPYINTTKNLRFACYLLPTGAGAQLQVLTILSKEEIQGTIVYTLGNPITVSNTNISSIPTGNKNANVGGCYLQLGTEGSFVIKGNSAVSGKSCLMTEFFPSTAMANSAECVLGNSDSDAPTNEKSARQFVFPIMNNEKSIELDFINPQKGPKDLIIRKRVFKTGFPSSATLLQSSDALTSTFDPIYHDSLYFKAYVQLTGGTMSGLGIFELVDETTKEYKFMGFASNDEGSATALRLNANGEIRLRGLPTGATVQIKEYADSSLGGDVFKDKYLAEEQTYATTGESGVVNKETNQAYVTISDKTNESVSTSFTVINPEPVNMFIEKYVYDLAGNTTLATSVDYPDINAGTSYYLKFGTGAYANGTSVAGKYLTFEQRENGAYAYTGYSDTLTSACYLKLADMDSVDPINGYYTQNGKIYVIGIPKSQGYSATTGSIQIYECYDDVSLKNRYETLTTMTDGTNGEFISSATISSTSNKYSTNTSYTEGDEVTHVATDSTRIVNNYEYERLLEVSKFVGYKNGSGQNVVAAATEANFPSVNSDMEFYITQEQSGGTVNYYIFDNDNNFIHETVEAASYDAAIPNEVTPLHLSQDGTFTVYGLPAGTYKIVERTDNFELIGAMETNHIGEITIRANDKHGYTGTQSSATLVNNTAGVALRNDAYYGSVMVQKKAFQYNWNNTQQEETTDVSGISFVIMGVSDLGLPVNKVITTNANGTALIENEIPVGTYLVVESNNPYKNYVTATSAQQVTVMYSDPSTPTVASLEFDNYKTEVYLEKIDPYDNHKISGATFTIYEDTNGDGVYQEGTDVVYTGLKNASGTSINNLVETPNNSGIYRAYGLEFGNYLLKETGISQNQYKIDPNYYPFTIDENNIAPILSNQEMNQYFVEQVPPVSITLTKRIPVDEINGNIWFPHGDPIFILELHDNDNNITRRHAFHFDEEYVNANKFTSGGKTYVEMSYTWDSEHDGLYPNTNYTASEVKTVRYSLTTINAITKGTYNSTLKTVSFNLSEGEEGKATFNNGKNTYKDLTHTSIAVNEIKTAWSAAHQQEP